MLWPQAGHDPDLRQSSVVACIHGHESTTSCHVPITRVVSRPSAFKTIRDTRVRCGDPIRVKSLTSGPLVGSCRLVRLTRDRTPEWVIASLVAVFVIGDTGVDSYTKAVTLPCGQCYH